MAKLEYTIIRSDRKTLALQITPDGRVVVRSPRHVTEARIGEFVRSKASWIEKHLATKQPGQPLFTNQQIHALADRALQVIPQRVRYYAPLVGVTYGSITIRNQKTRWGSCTAEGNLNFNCLLMLAPPEVLDYVVIHELCHRKEMNHSDKFWAQVARLCPDYKERRKWLKTHGTPLIARLGE